MSEYVYFQSIVQYRVPIDGGNPEVLKKFTTEIKGKHPKKKPKLDLTVNNQGTTKK